MSTVTHPSLRELIDSIREDELEQRLPPPPREPISSNIKVVGRARRRQINYPSNNETD